MSPQGLLNRVVTAVNSRDNCPFLGQWCGELAGNLDIDFEFLLGDHNN